MRMKAIMYGGGNIGRGFIGSLFSQSGYQVTFVDVAEPVVDALNREHQYPVRIVSSKGHQDIDITNVNAVNGKNEAAVAEAIAGADIMATAVGVNILKFIVPNIVAGLRRRFATTDAPLNIIICENLMDANKVLEGMIKEQLTAEECALFDERIGLVEASIGRMVPVQTPEMQDGNPLRVCVESYGYLPVDKDAFKGGIPSIKSMIPFSPFDFYIKRKLYVHNMGHATCAYLGMYTGCEYIYQSIDDTDTFAIVENAMLESAQALSKKYGVPLNDIVLHIQDLLCRFTNKALGDTCKRVGGDTTRKLSPQDRMIGTMNSCTQQGIVPAYLYVGIAGALYQHIKEQGSTPTPEVAKEVLLTLCQLQQDDVNIPFILQILNLYIQNASVKEIRKTALLIKEESLKDIV